MKCLDIRKEEITAALCGRESGQALSGAEVQMARMEPATETEHRSSTAPSSAAH